MRPQRFPRRGFEFVLSVMTVQLIAGSTGLVCYTAVESLDLGCLLRWDCPHASPNITYTVQTKTQGDPWQDVPWCVWISSRSCDVSQVFSNFELYNMIRLGVHLSPSSIVWIKPHKFDYSDFTFSPPSVSVSWNNDSLSVKVQFPCATSRGCSRDVCCPISTLIDPWTTVTVFNELNRSDNQSRTVWTQEVVSVVEFSGLSPGQNYCAEANFSFPTFSMAASPKSAPGCVETGSRSGMLPMLCLGTSLSFVFLLLFLLVFLRKLRRDRPARNNPPKALATSQDAESLAPPVCVPVEPCDPCDPCDIHLELIDDHGSVDWNIENKSSSQLVHRDPSRGVVCCHNGGQRQKKGLDSGVRNPTLSHFYVETSDEN
ncbi:PREDICTED: uncharacterized protein LOC106932176 [Poecilia mexicana]|uniref:uncharacterized protein LOC103146007 n=1 Tax=Poecilia formosa TaxID=48698 RepID=UPI00072E26D0|nr:PREDICTED: uncharacterized protein LOC103146007 [Poecilia formosa]XP_014866220.1 PREDICTED: uncharacterized protein LOC106932176 [Poecilia mexicana]